MKEKNGYYTLKKNRLKAFTLLECLVALLVIAGTVLVYDGLARSVKANIHYLSNNQEEEWLLFSQQLRSELEGGQLDRVASNKLYVTKANQHLAFGQSNSHDFRKTNASGRGYQPMLFGLQSSSISQDGQQVTIKLGFKNRMEREFVYTFKTEG